MTVINIWSEKQSNTVFENLPPDRMVYAVRLIPNEDEPDFINGLLASEVYTNELDAKNHWWNRKSYSPGTGMVVPMTFHEYLKASFEECKGMNPFWDLGRIAFFDKWLSFHGEKDLT